MFSVGVDLLASGQAEAALSVFERSLTSAVGKQKSDSLYNIAVCHVRLGRNQKAVEAVREALVLDPALASEMKSDQDLAPLVSDEAYREILAAALSTASSQPTTFGEEMRRLRKSSGLTLTELAARSGISRQALIDMELDRPGHFGMNVKRVAEQLHRAGATSEYLSSVVAGRTDGVCAVQASPPDVRTLETSMAPTASGSSMRRIADILAAFVSIIGVYGLEYVRDNLRGTADAFLAFAIVLCMSCAYPGLRTLRFIRAKDKLDQIASLWNRSRNCVSSGNYEAALSLLDNAIQLNRKYAGPCQIYLERGKTLATLGREQDAIHSLELFESKATNVKALANELAEAHLLLGQLRSGIQR